MKLKLFIALLVAFIASGLKTDSLTQTLTEANLSIDLPNDSWFLANKGNANGMTVYYFKRTPIEDSEGRQIVPNISVIIEGVDKGLDVVAYSTLKRAHMNFDVAQVFTHHDGILMYENAVGYKGNYVDGRGLNHTVYIVHAINDKTGIQFICDVITNVLKKVENEFLTSLKSIRRNQERSR